MLSSQPYLLPLTHQTAADLVSREGGSTACGSPGWVLGGSWVGPVPTADRVLWTPLLTPKSRVSPCRRAENRSPSLGVQLGVSRVPLARDTLYDILRGEKQAFSKQATPPHAAFAICSSLARSQPTGAAATTGPAAAGRPVSPCLPTLSLLCVLPTQPAMPARGETAELPSRCGNTSARRQ